MRAALDPTAHSTPEPGRVADGCVELAEVARDTGLAHGAEILSLVDACLERAGLALEDVSLIAVSSGPGSFTGLRVALATAKGLALAGDVPLVGVPTLEALAATVLPSWSTGSPLGVPDGTVVVACLDARKGEVYAAGFVVREPVWSQPNPWLERLASDAAYPPEAFAGVLSGWLGTDRPGLLVGDGAPRYAAEIVEPLGARVNVLSFPGHAPRGAIVARLGAGLLAHGGPHDRAALVPSYARASEAEILRARRGAGGPSEAR